jgi:hypothetical protein
MLASARPANTWAGPPRTRMSPSNVTRGPPLAAPALMTTSSVRPASAPPGEGEGSRRGPEIPEGGPDSAGIRDPSVAAATRPTETSTSAETVGSPRIHVARSNATLRKGRRATSVSEPCRTGSLRSDSRVIEKTASRRTGSSRRRSRDPSRRRSCRRAGTSDPRPPGRTARRPRPPRPRRRGRPTRRPPTARTTRPSTSARGLANRPGSARTRPAGTSNVSARHACPVEGPDPDRRAPLPGVRHLQPDLPPRRSAAVRAEPSTRGRTCLVRRCERSGRGIAVGVRGAGDQRHRDEERDQRLQPSHADPGFRVTQRARTHRSASRTSSTVRTH